MVIKKVREAGNREAVFMSNGLIRTVIDAGKGMVPELSARTARGWTNAHWNPWFRSNSGEEWNDEKHASFWKVPLLYDIAGNFPCVPNFGPDNRGGGYDLPPHGYTAFEKWDQSNLESGESFLAFTSHLSPGAHPFEYDKKDLILKNQHILYTKLEIRNNGSKTEFFNCAWHNTVGSPFLESGCLIDNNGQSFAVPPKGTEFDETGRLAFGAVTDSLVRVPTREGKNINLREVPGIIGCTDFITGAVPRDCSLGWASVVNPRLKLIYLSFFTGPAAVKSDELPLYFYDLWMNYGGRPFEPWAHGEGMTDQTFCLGTENATAHFANGLASALENRTLLGNPTVLEIDPAERKTLYYGTLFQTYEGEIFDKGIKSLSGKDGMLVLESYNGEVLSVPCDYTFEKLKA